MTNIIPYNFATETVIRLSAKDDKLQAIAASIGDRVGERALLGAILDTPPVYDTLNITARDFSDMFCAMGFHCLSTLILNRKDVSAYSLHDELMRQSYIAKSSDWTSEAVYKEIAMIQALASANKNVDDLERAIMDNAVRIRTACAYLYGLDVITDKSVPIHEALSQGGKAIDEAMQRMVVKASDLQSIFKRMVENGETIDYLPTSYDGLDAKIVGFPTRQVSVVGAETGKGKTTFFVNVAGKVSAEKTTSDGEIIDGALTVIFTKETSDIEALQKLFMNYTGVPVESYAGEGLSEEEMQRVAYASTEVLKSKLVIVDDVKPMTPQNVMRRFRKIEREWGEPIRLCIVDGLYNSDHPDTDDLWERQVRVIDDYTEYAKDTDAAFVLTAQLKKQTYMKLDTQNRPPDVDDFEGWNKTYQGIQNIFCMVYSLIDRDIMKFYIIKQRSRSKQRYGEYHKFFIDESRNRYIEQPVNNDDIPF